jgi:SET domain-containing protein
MRQSELIRVQKVPGKGRGVFARKAIKKGQLIEQAPVLLVPADVLVDGLENPCLGKYSYWWTPKRMAIALGYGSLYNHSYEANTTFEVGKESIRYVADRDIPAGEEITINYNGDADDKSPVGFKVMK